MKKQDVGNSTPAEAPTELCEKSDKLAITPAAGANSQSTPKASFTVGDIRIALKTIDDLAIFASIHGSFTEPVEGLIKVCDWLRSVATGERPDADLALAVCAEVATTNTLETQAETSDALVESVKAFIESVSLEAKEIQRAEKGEEVKKKTMSWEMQTLLNWKQRFEKALKK